MDTTITTRFNKTCIGVLRSAWNSSDSCSNFKESEMHVFTTGEVCRYVCHLPHGNMVISNNGIEYVVTGLAIDA